VKIARPDTNDLKKQVEFLLQHKRSFNLYVIHEVPILVLPQGPMLFRRLNTNLILTSYDYDAPINEQGRPTPKYFMLRELISRYVVIKFRTIPEPVPVIEIPGIEMKATNSI